MSRSVICAVICVLFFSAIALAQRGPGGPGGPPAGPSPEERERMRVAVGMTKDQQNQVEAIYQDGRKREEELRKKSGELSKQLKVLYDSYSFDRAQASTLRKDMCDLFKQRMAIHAETQDKVRKVLTKEQFDKLTTLAREMFDKRMQEWRQKGREFGGPGGFGGHGPGFGRPPGPRPNL